MKWKSSVTKFEVFWSYGNTNRFITEKYFFHILLGFFCNADNGQED